MGKPPIDSDCLIGRLRTLGRNAQGECIGASLRQFEDKAQQHVRSSDEIRRCGIFFDVVADPADARNEDHAGRTDRSHDLCIMSGTAGQASDRKAELTGDCFDTLNQPWRECDRRKAGVGERKHMAGNVDAKQTLLSYYWSLAQIFVS